MKLQACAHCKKPLTTSQVAFGNRYCSNLCANRSTASLRGQQNRENALRYRYEKYLVPPNGVIVSSRGAISIVSPEDVVFARSFTWTVTSHGYAFAHGVRGTNRRHLSLSREIMQRVLGVSLKPNEFVDHINHDTLDNRRENLRIASPESNTHNMGLKRNSRNRFKGIGRMRSGRFCARIRVGGTRIYLGTYDSDIEAAYIYDQFALVLFGDFAHTNLIGENIISKE